MQVEKTVIISNNFHKIVSNFSKEISKELITEVIQHKDEINDLLTGYTCQERGSVYSHTIDGTTIEIDKNGKGSFIVDFVISYALENYDDKDKMKIEFQIDLKTGEMRLKGEVE